MIRLVMFTQSFCIPCKQLKPQVTTAIEHLSEYRISLEEWDVENNWNLAKQYNVKSTPTLIIVDDNNNELYRFTSKKVLGIINEIKSYVKQ